MQIGRPTQKDVAKLAGVSRAVVSSVLYGSKSTIRVSDETAERVRAAALQLGYRPNVSARNLKRQRTGMIGIMHGDGFPRMPFRGETGYLPTLMDGIVDSAFERDISVCMCPKLFSQTPEDAMADGRFDGLVWYSSWPSEANLARLRSCSVPVVIIHSQAADFENQIPTVICDNFEGVRLALEHLAELGHRSVGYAYDGEFLFGEARIRREAVLEIAPTLGMDPSLIDVRGDLTGLHAYLAAPRAETAILAQNEWLAGQVMSGLQSKGVDVPGEVSIVGFDSTYFCNLQTPKLTAVSQPLLSMGRRAVEMLIEVIDGQLPSPIEAVFPCVLDIRESTGPAPVR